MEDHDLEQMQSVVRRAYTIAEVQKFLKNTLIAPVRMHGSNLPYLSAVLILITNFLKPSAHVQLLAHGAWLVAWAIIIIMAMVQLLLRMCTAN